MTRAKRVRANRASAATEETPTPEAVADATSEETTEQEQVSKAELLARIQNEFANRPSEPKRVTIADLYQQAVALIASSMGYRTTKLRSETTAVRIYELTLMWALNNRDRVPSHDILPDEMGSNAGEPEVPEDEGPDPDETIEAAPEPQES